MNTQILSDDSIQSQEASPTPLSDDEFQRLLDAFEADRRLKSAEFLIATRLVDLSRERGYADVTIAELAQLGRVTTRAAMLIKKRLAEHGYFHVDKGNGQRPGRFVPLKIPIQTIKRSRL